MPKNLREEMGGTVMLLHGVDAQGMPEDIPDGPLRRHDPCAPARLDWAAIQHLRTAASCLRDRATLCRGHAWSREYVFRVE